MAEYLIQDATLTSIADEVRILSGIKEALSPDAIKEKVAEGNEDIAVEANLIAQITSALEGKSSGNSVSTNLIKITFSDEENAMHPMTEIYYIDKNFEQKYLSVTGNEIIDVEVLRGSVIWVGGENAKPSTDDSYDWVLSDYQMYDGEDWYAAGKDYYLVVLNNGTYNFSYY